MRQMTAKRTDEAVITACGIVKTNCTKSVDPTAPCLQFPPHVKYKHSDHASKPSKSLLAFCAQRWLA